MVYAKGKIGFPGRYIRHRIRSKGYMMRKGIGILIFLGATMVSLSAGQTKGGVFTHCNGDYWASVAVEGKKLGKTCIHCRNGAQIKLYVKKGGRPYFQYYTLDKRYVGGPELRDVINRICY
jgi:hypothetical protein